VSSSHRNFDFAIKDVKMRYSELMDCWKTVVQGRKTSAAPRRLRFAQQIAAFIFTILLSAGGFLYTPIVANGQDGNPFLGYLSVDGFEFTGPFRHTVTYYTVEIPESVTRLDVNARPQAATSRIEISGNENLQPGINHIIIEVSAENGVVLEYEIEVVKAGPVDASNALLQSLVVQGYILNPIFNSGTFEYFMDVNFEVLTLDIAVIPVNLDATVQIFGADDLTVGVNEVVIVVTSADGSLTQEYSIEVNKLDEITDEMASALSEHEGYEEGAPGRFLSRYGFIAAGIVVLTVLPILFLCIRRKGTGGPND